MIDREDIYIDEEEKEEDLSGFSIVDESGTLVVDALKEESEEETIATPVPENQFTVLLDNPALLLPGIGERLELRLENEKGAVFYEGKKAGDFKTAFIKKLREQKAGQYAAAYFYSCDPAMVRLEFSLRPKKGSVKIE